MERIPYASGQVITRAIADIRSQPGNTKLGFATYAFAMLGLDGSRYFKLPVAFRIDKKHFSPTSIGNTEWII